MIITKTPFRITLGGGGTDLPSYYSKYGGFIFSASINKYMFISVNQPVLDDLIRIRHDKVETAKNIDDIQHEIAREALRVMKIKKNIEITSMSDIAAGTGLGSSSCYAVGLINSLCCLKKKRTSPKLLADKACNLEIEILKKPVGKQDQYMAAYGGLTILNIDKQGKVRVRKANISENTLRELNKNLLAFYTNRTRSSTIILGDQGKNIRNNRGNVVNSMHAIKEIGYKILKAAESGNISKIGLLFDEHWQNKKKTSGKISNPAFNKIYNIAKDNGALGGKISGAGGGGFFVFYVEKNHNKFVKLMEKMGLDQMKYGFNFEGSKLLINS